MRQQHTFTLLLTGLTLVTAEAIADDYSFEVGLAYDRSQTDAEQTIVTTGGTIFNSNDVDTDSYGVAGSWYFSGLSDEEGPRARAAFVDRASVLTFQYTRSEQSYAVSIVSTDPTYPPFEASLDSNGDSYALSGRYVWRDSGWFGTAGVASTDTSIGGFVVESIDATAWSLGAGKYLFDTTTVALAVSQTDDGGGDATSVVLTFSHLGDMGASWQYGVDLGYNQTDSDADFKLDVWSAAFSLYPNRDIEFGIHVQEQDSNEDFLGSTSYGGFLSWFVSPQVELAAHYEIVDADLLGNIILPGADTTRDVDQDSFGLSIAVRF